MENAHVKFVEAYVEDLLRTGDLHRGAVERAFRRVRRHRFLDHWYCLDPSSFPPVWSRFDFDRDGPDSHTMSTIYSDRSLVTGIDGYRPTTSTSQPRLMARMIETLQLEPGMRVLEVGTGTGYNTALLAETLGEPANVFSVELRPEIAELARKALRQEGYGDARLLVKDGAFGAEEGAPYDRIMVTAGCADISPAWLEQLKPEGRLLAPIQHGHLDPLLEFQRAGEVPGGATARVVGRSTFMPMAGALAGPNAWQSFLIGGMPHESLWLRDLPIKLPGTEEGHPLGVDTHRSVQFYLSLVSRELWQTNKGYGLADPQDGAAALVTTGGLEVLYRPESERRAEELASKLERLLVAWDRLGRPAPGDYDIVFEPKAVLPRLSGDGREWVIERTHFWQIVRLAQPVSAT